MTVTDVAGIAGAAAGGGGQGDAAGHPLCGTLQWPRGRGRAYGDVGGGCLRLL